MRLFVTQNYPDASSGGGAKMSKKKEIRNHFRESVFTRDSHKCKVCGCSDKPLDAHHICDRNEIPNGGYIPENGISLCPDCHLKAEKFHISKGTSFEEGYHPDQLYALISSSRTLAFKKASEQ